MKLVMVSVLLLAMLTFQPTLIYGSASKAKKHATAAAHTSLTSTAKLVLAMDSGDVLTRAARAAAADNIDTDTAALPPVGAETAATAAVGNNAGVGSKRKNNNNNNRKLNKNSSPENASHAGRKHLDKKFSAAAGNQQQQQQQRNHHQSAGNSSNNNNNKGKQRQLLKSQQHQNHGKRSGSKSKAGNGDKALDGEKSPSTCRYAKSKWSQCDAKTNTRSRTLTLREGESTCLPTRTMQKKCKACRYEKGSWSECSNGQMTRQDKLKSTGNAAPAADVAGAAVTDSSCEPVRNINKKCNPGRGAGKHGGGKANKERKNKEKANRRAQLHA